jgi:hypothetical protein
MDALSEILRVVRLDSAIYFNAELSEPWCLASPEARTLAPVLARGAAHVIIYHLLCEGGAYVQVQDGERVALSPGDIVTFPHGHGHLLGSGPSVAPVDVASALPGVLEKGLELLHLGGGGAASRFICGFLACDPQRSQAFLVSTREGRPARRSRPCRTSDCRTSRRVASERRIGRFD